MSTMDDVSGTSVAGFANLTPAELRLAESKQLFQLFKESGRADHDQTLFLMTTFFDSFLFCLISIEAMADDDLKNQLSNSQMFTFFKALRNISMHHSVLTGLKDTKFPRPIARVVSLAVGSVVEDATEFFIVPEKLNHIFDQVEKEWPRESGTISAARAFLESLVARANKIYVADLMTQVLSETESIVARHVLSGGHN